MVLCVGLECVVVRTLYYDRVCEDDGWLAFVTDTVDILSYLTT